MMDLTPAQNAIFLFIAKHANLDQNVTFESFSFEPDISEFYDAAYARIPSAGAPVYAVATLPRKSDRIFICISDGDPETIAKVLLGLQHYDDKVAQLCMGDTVSLSNNDEVRKSGWSAGFIVNVAFLLTDFPEWAEIYGKKYLFYLVLFLNERERVVKINGGVEALMDLFGAERRDIVTFHQPGRR